jgi:hypothetical protein
MKSPDKKRGPPATGSRTGPRARAAQERQFIDPYQRGARPSREPEAGAGPERSPGRSAVVTLEPDVARVFRTSEAVNEALRLVLRLARFGAGRPAFDRDRPAGRAPGRPPGPFAPRPAGPPRRGADRTETRGERRPPARREPKFRDSE